MTTVFYRPLSISSNVGFVFDRIWSDGTNNFHLNNIIGENQRGLKQKIYKKISRFFCI